jgi:aminoglycoside 3-N-acetyltransferase I
MLFHPPSTSTKQSMDIQISKLSSNDLKDFLELVKVFEVVFEMNDFKMPEAVHLQRLLDKPDFFSLVARVDNRVAGGLTVYILHRYYSTKPGAYIYDMGVLPEYQRKGIGKKLIGHLFGYCRENNFEEVYVEAESGDTGAVNFYRQLHFSSELQATHFTYSFSLRDRDFNKPQ